MKMFTCKLGFHWWKQIYTGQIGKGVGRGVGKLVIDGTDIPEMFWPLSMNRCRFCKKVRQTKQTKHLLTQLKELKASVEQQFQKQLGETEKCH